jgi:hypothetical protein
VGVGQTVARPYWIRILLLGGEPDGLRLIEKSNWNGAGLVVPRALLSDAKQRKEMARTGVYVLFAPPEGSGLPRVYVGEGDPIRPRLDQHAAKKDFWTHCICFTSKDDNLNKAHVQYLEACLVGLAGQNKRCALDNGNVPAPPSLSESDVADADGFLAEMLLCFPVLGLNVFSAATTSGATKRVFYLSGKGVTAEGHETAEGFFVRAGSRAVGVEVPSCHAFVKDLRTALIKNGVLRSDADAFAFAQDYVFPSPSTAAGVVLGRSSNGRIDWKTKDGQTLKQIQETDPSA